MFETEIERFALRGHATTCHLWVRERSRSNIPGAPIQCVLHMILSITSTNFQPFKNQKSSDIDVFQLYARLCPNSYIF